MRHARTPGFEPLEGRELMTAARHAVAHPAPAAITLAPVGTLVVDDRDATAAMNVLGSSTTSTPVAGVLGTLGKVRGVWEKTYDTFGDYVGPDTLRLRNPRGTFVITFNAAHAGKVRHLAGGATTFEVADRVRGGTGAYAGASGGGTITLVGNPGKSGVGKLTLGPGVA